MMSEPYKIVCGSPHELGEIESKMSKLHEGGYELNTTVIPFHASKYPPALMCVIMSKPE